VNSAVGGKGGAFLCCSFILKCLFVGVQNVNFIYFQHEITVMFFFFFLRQITAVAICKVYVSLVYSVFHFSSHCILYLSVIMLQRTASCVSRVTTFSFARDRLH
jgi:hypothetical protein